MSVGDEGRSGELNSKADLPNGVVALSDAEDEGRGGGDILDPVPGRVVRSNGRGRGCVLLPDKGR